MKHLTIPLLAALVIAGCSDSGSLPVTERTENIKAATFDPELQKPKDDGCRDGLFACEVRRAEARNANKAAQANAARKPELPED